MKPRAALLVILLAVQTVWQLVQAKPCGDPKPGCKMKIVRTDVARWVEVCPGEPGFDDRPSREAWQAKLRRSRWKKKKQQLAKKKRRKSRRRSYSRSYARRRSYSRRY